MVCVIGVALLTVRDSSASQSGKMINSNYVFNVNEGARLTVDGGTFTSLKKSAVYAYENITINGGSLVEAEYAVRMSSSGVKVTLNVGSFTGGRADLMVYNSSSVVMNYAKEDQLTQPGKCLKNNQEPTTGQTPRDWLFLCLSAFWRFPQ